MDLIHSPFGGRYCGQIPPRRRVSLFRSSVIGFFTDKNTTEEILFQGSYLFFKDGKFLQIKQDPIILVLKQGRKMGGGGLTFVNNVLRLGASCFRGVDQFQVGTPVPKTTCNFTIDGVGKRTGDIMTPTYPGVYPKDLACAYRFSGKKGQRIRLEFRDFDTFYGGPQ